MEDLNTALSTLNLSEMKGVKRKFRHQVFEKTIMDTQGNNNVTFNGLVCPGVHIKTRFYGRPRLIQQGTGFDIPFGTAGEYNVPLSTFKTFIQQATWSSNGQEFVNDSNLSEYFDAVCQELQQDESSGDFV